MSSPDFRAAVRAAPVESAVGVVVTVAGAALAVFEASLPLRAVGMAITTCGTILLSWALTKVTVAHQQNLELARNLQSIARPLSTVVSQLSYAVMETDQDDETSIDNEIVRMSVQHLYGVLSDIQVVVGSPLGVDEVLSIKGKLDLLGKKLAAAETNVDATAPERADTRNLLKQAAEELDSITRRIQRTYQTTTVRCPICSSSVNAVIGDIPGDSAMATCSSCTSRFHAHRAGDGSVGTKAWGAAKQQLRVGVRPACPSCGHETPFNFARGALTPVQRFCLHCYAKVSYSPETREVTLVRPGIAPEEGVLAPDQSYLVCPRCNQPKRTMYNRDGEYFGVCQGDDILLHARLGGGDTIGPTLAPV